MNRFDIGDEITVRKNLRRADYGIEEVFASPNMVLLRGKKAKIMHKYDDFLGTTRYILDIDEGEHVWVEEMFEENRYYYTKRSIT